MGRIIVIGDVHGCLVELTDLLAKLKAAKDDQLIFLGDLVNRGPDSHGVVSLVRGMANAVSLLGNHELRLLQYRKERDPKVLKEYDWTTVRQLDEQDWKYLQGMKLTYYLPEFQTVCVHAGFLPDQPWDKQGAEIVTRIQVIDERGPAAQAHRGAAGAQLGRRVGRPALRRLWPYPAAGCVSPPVVARARHRLRLRRLPLRLHPARARNRPSRRARKIPGLTLFKP